jgi:hypothetical protein
LLGTPLAGGSGYTVLPGQSLYSFPRKTSATFCWSWSLLRKALIQAVKTLSNLRFAAAETLYAIFFELFPKIYKNMLL